MILSDISFGSGFLLKEVKSLFNIFLNQPSPSSLYKMLSLLWATQRLLTPSEMREMINNFLEALSKVPNLSVEEKASSVLFLMIIEQKDKTIVKTIKKKFDKLKIRYPATFRELLPHRKKRI